MSEKRHVVMLANGHPPFDTRIFVKEARSLVKAGYDVSIILPHSKDEVKDGVNIIATAPLRGGFHKLFLSPFNILFKALRQRSGSIFHIHDSDILHIGVILKLLGKKVVYDAHEDTPLQISYQHWIPKLLRKPYALYYYCLEKFCGWIFDAIIVAEPVIAKYFPPKKTFLVRNFPQIDYFREHAPVDYRSRARRLAYVGSITNERGLQTMLDASVIAKKSVNFDFVLGGQFSPLSLQQETLSKYPVTFLGWLNFPQLVDLLFDSQIGIIIPKPNDRYKTNYPVKLFEFMAAGLPSIASREGESAMFVNECDGGILVDPTSNEEVANAIVKLFADPEKAQAMGERAQRLIFEKYNWDVEARTLLNVYSGFR